jgi:hypothetical protein
VVSHWSHSLFNAKGKRDEGRVWSEKLKRAMMIQTKGEFSDGKSHFVDVIAMIQAILPLGTFQAKKNLDL